MTPEQHRWFQEQGFLYMPGAVGKNVVQPFKTHVLNELKRLNIWSAGRAQSKKLQGVPVFQQTARLGQLISHPDLNEKLISKELHSAMCVLADSPLSGQGTQLLISLPHKVEWTLEGLNWHRDVSQSQLKGIPGVQAFILLDKVSPKGGATLALAGSHRLKNQSQAKQGISMLTGHGNNHSTKVGGIELSITEMAGGPGDVYLMDMRLLHTPSVNSTRNVRIMATNRYFIV
ncbi:hypothetical protein E4656_12195 [Natronospirillum operosum]|uniref:Phytanoyl-CoA dioxygenase n=1 Tax=Natronospirillum operosum TaxID=2759953 RepID=A0A4Z0WCZ9_9GAMM|nr:phytanoyl-CoA dioxygenase family protein [Natronospirillum operosum]TGG92880.1 hypothetical protein E4656_12195 [Natronospirillum operosum]